MTEKLLTDEMLMALIAKLQAHSEIMAELGSENEEKEARQILNALCELKRYRLTVDQN
ncbi:hypothetical protein ACVNA6_000281 [Klebsiella aerogenes]|uniref:hypothetical protein n=1 Tax=Klebsiella aerogenes TaxID=548 RepID=UPI000A44138A|nr:hypothetical protein [Klebsiella aerogenes]EKZ6149724.1 hypothetical protein [Klebsiella aerogenes]ELA4984580.1 hypothetical protein [Klebsiella aerogenes]UWA53722.1 hypothetical protein M5T48_15355 [Klebsiella aerogenes]HBV5503765.1 hypothetical protein [Klebsiella aerogenes]HCW3469750.1 hypothetical protein [Klebsiella aerogenes]